MKSVAWCGISIIIHRHTYIYLLIWHSGPVKPGRQTHLYTFTKSIQVAPLWHGIEAHSSISGRRYEVCYRDLLMAMDSVRDWYNSLTNQLSHDASFIGHIKELLIPVYCTTASRYKGLRLHPDASWDTYKLYYKIYQNLWHVFHKVMEHNKQLQQYTKTEHLYIAWTVKVTLF